MKLVSSINMDFLRKLLKLNITVAMSFCMQQVKVGPWLLREACWGEEEGPSSSGVRKRVPLALG